jgi:ferredoxin
MLYVDPDICTGCGICVNVCPDGFAMENGLARVKDASASCAAEARDVCPVSAIRDGDTPAEKSASAERPAERSPRGEGSGGGRGLRGRGRGRGRSA